MLRRSVLLLVLCSLAAACASSTQSTYRPIGAFDSSNRRVEQINTGGSPTDPR